jgi:ATP phosphoribosyltransferase
VEVIARSTARFIVNRASLRLKHEPLMELIRKLRAAIGIGKKASVAGASRRSAAGKVRKRTVRP